MNDVQIERAIRKTQRGWLLWMVLLVTGFCVGLMTPVGETTGTVAVDTVTVRDTVRDTVPKVVVSEVVRYVKERPVNGNDTAAAQRTEGEEEHLAMTDSGEVVVPITRKVYTDDSTYRAVVSGYKACLDEIETYRVTRIITKTTTKTKKWNVGLTGGLGYGITTRKADVWVGFGMVYNIPP